MKNIFLLSIWLFINARAYAGKPCTQGPDCEKLNNTVKNIKTLKEKRHDDVKTFGRKSSQVRSDDEEITRAVQIDESLRQERNQAKKPVGYHRAHKKEGKPQTPAPQKRPGLPMQLIS